MMRCYEALGQSQHGIFMDLPVLEAYSRLPHPLILPLSSPVTALWLWPWLTASLHKGTECLCACLRVWMCKLIYNTMVWRGRVQCVSQMWARVTCKSAALVKGKKEKPSKIQNTKKIPFSRIKKEEKAKWEPLLLVQYLHAKHNSLIWQENSEGENTSEEEGGVGGGEENKTVHKAVLFHSQTVPNWQFSQNNNRFIFGRKCDTRTGKSRKLYKWMHKHIRHDNSYNHS